MKKITLSINPTYLCNFRCDFCYLTSEQLSDKNKLDLNLLKKRLLEVTSSGYQIEHVDLYGGEIALLPHPYLSELDNLLQEFGDPSINIVTNLSKIHPYFLEDHIDLSVSFDFKARELSDLVLSNMAVIKKEISVLMLASPELLKQDIDFMINILSSMQNIVSVEIKPYSSNQANQLDVEYVEYELFIKEWLKRLHKVSFEFVNYEQIKLAKSKKRNAFSDDHVYITPSGQFAVLEFDQSNNEFFMELNNFDEYINWSISEKERLFTNKACSSCEFFGHCLTEHYKTSEVKNKSCNGFYNLLI